MVSSQEFPRLMLALTIVVGIAAFYLWKTNTVLYRRFTRLMLGLGMVVAGITLCLTGVGAIIGLPLILVGLWLQYRAAFRSGI